MTRHLITGRLSAVQIGQNAQLAVFGTYLPLVADPNNKLVAVLVENTPETGAGRVLVFGDITMFTNEYLDAYSENRLLTDQLAAWALRRSRVLTGNVVLGQYVHSPQGVPMLISVYLGDSRVDQEQVTLESQGAYWAIVEAEGVVDVVAKPSHWLSVRARNVNLGQTGTTWDFVIPVNGDADGDDFIGLADLSRILVVFGTGLDPNADLDGSGLADLPDLALVLTSFGKRGEG